MRNEKWGEAMKKSELPEYSKYIITEYYKNNIQPFLDSFAENCLWIGPAEGQMIYSKEALLNAFSAETHQLTFAMQNIELIPMSVSRTSLDVILTYRITSYYPNGETTVFNQRVDLLWITENQNFRIRVCHISNEFPYDSRDKIYPNHFTELPIASTYVGNMSSEKIPIKGLRNNYFYLNINTIMWMESNGHHTLIHTVDKVYEAADSLSCVTEQIGDSLCRIHASYTVNPIYVKSIARFHVLLEDGTWLPIPEKKYTQVKKTLTGMRTL